MVVKVPINAVCLVRQRGRPLSNLVTPGQQIPQSVLEPLIFFANYDHWLRASHVLMKVILDERSVEDSNLGMRKRAACSEW